LTTGPESERSRWFYRVRVGFLLAVLGGVLLYAAKDIHSRRARNDWDRTLVVALVVVREGPITDPSVAALRGRLPALEDRLYEESRRYDPRHAKPIRFELFGPIDTPGPRPQVGLGLRGAVVYAYEKWRFLREIDDRAHLPTGDFDSRVYLLASPPVSSKRARVEGESEQGGRVGLVGVELVDKVVDFALIVAAHELFHTLGATDKYDAQGNTSIPAGLVEPDKVPRYPQDYVEIMARFRPTSATAGELPDTLADLAVGPVTAREIGWSAPAP
jgi:hypothetical protein